MGHQEALRLFLSMRSLHLYGTGCYTLNKVKGPCTTASGPDHFAKWSDGSVAMLEVSEAEARAMEACGVEVFSVWGDSGSYHAIQGEHDPEWELGDSVYTAFPEIMR